MPRRFNTITVTDGIAMGHQGMKSSLVSREVIADSVELVGARPLLRRAGRLRRVRQVAARHDDGDAAPQHPVDLRLWRLDPARPLPRQATSPSSTCSRWSANIAAGTCPLERGPRARKGRLPRPRRVRRPVHRQHHGLRRRGDRPVACRTATWCPRLTRTREQIAVAAGAQVMELLARNLRPRDICTRAAFDQRRARRRGDRRLDQRRAASAGDGERGGDRIRPVRRRRGRSSRRPTSPTSSPAGSMSPRTCTRPAASTC